MSRHRVILIGCIGIACMVAGADWAEAHGTTARSLAKTVLIGAGRTPQDIGWRIEAERHGPGSTSVNFETHWRTIRSVTPGSADRSCGAIGYHGAPSTRDGVIFEGPISPRVDRVSVRFIKDGSVVPSHTELRRVSKREAAELGEPQRFGWFVASAPVTVDDSWRARATPISSGERLGQFAGVREIARQGVTPTFEFACGRSGNS